MGRGNGLPLNGACWCLFVCSVLCCLMGYMSIVGFDVTICMGSLVSVWVLKSNLDNNYKIICLSPISPHHQPLSQCNIAFRQDINKVQWP